MGILFLMIAGSLDLSVGYEMALIGVVVGILNVQMQMRAGIVIIIAILLGILMSVFNTVIGMFISLPSILITLAMQTIYQGIAYTLSNSATYRGLSDTYIFMGQGFIGAFPFPVLLAIGAIAIAAFILNKTYIGRYVYALGGNADAAKLSGINISKMRLIIAIVAGFFVGVGTVVMTARLGSTNASYGPGSEFTAITAICLGGVSVNGGKGSVMGVVAGVLTLAIISNGMQLAGLGTYAQYIIKGLILLLAFGFDVYQKAQQQKVKLKK